MAPSAVVRFKSRALNGLFPSEPIAVPRTLLTIEFAELLPKLLAEFWPAVVDDVEGVPAETPAAVEAVTFTVNDKRAPKNGTLADIVEENEDLNICVVIKGADNFPGLWIPINKPQVEAAAVMAPLKKRKGGAGAVKVEGGAPEGEADSLRRKIKRWDPEETKLLLSLVTEHGKGKWKKVLEIGEGTFDKHRTTVDLKDKWRNLEKSGVAPKLPDNLETKRGPRKKKAAGGGESLEGTSMQELATDAINTGVASEQLLAAVVAQQPQLLAAVTADAGMAGIAAGAAADAVASAPAMTVAPATVAPEPTTLPIPDVGADAAAEKPRATRTRK
mmetsp:Transcript_938/g.2447  ORF Transcript_938/g.2447 Transcript_938/m.2447 type:complete len:331 (-) Transcript_938:135-1127(-)